MLALGTRLAPQEAELSDLWYLLSERFMQMRMREYEVCMVCMHMHMRHYAPHMHDRATVRMQLMLLACMCTESNVHVHVHARARISGKVHQSKVRSLCASALSSPRASSHATAAVAAALLRCSAPLLPSDASDVRRAAKVPPPRGHDMLMHGHASRIKHAHHDHEL